MRDPDGTFPTTEAHEAMLQRVIDVGKQVGTPTGMHAMSAEAACARANQGMQFIAVASDLKMLTERAQETVAQIKPETQQEDIARY
ncbi:MAG TPA: hypothetical protein DCY79_13490 [Planctomycetaceae bacterium]|nr:hypothetical protein [Planctomycetaceae bacterium]